MQLLGRRNPAIQIPPAPAVERVLQIGEGCFIRAFVDWLLHELRVAGRVDFNGGVVLTPARATGAPKIAELAAQDYLYTVWTRGLSGGEMVDKTEVVSIITRAVNPFEDWPAFLTCAEQQNIDIVVSNTTEMGIVYTPTPRPTEAAPASYPARLTAYLWRRFERFAGAPQAGLVILPCELIDDNGAVLRDIVLRHAADWALGRDFALWVERHNLFCNTLVDRITPGFPHSDVPAVWERLGYEDKQLVVTEPYYLWAIEADERVMRRLPFERTDLNVVYTDDLPRYRILKLRALNGAHTFMAPLGLWLGLRTVRDAMTHPRLGALVHKVLDEIIAPYTELDAATLRAYAATVFERFLNPYIEHRLKDITLYSVGKLRIRLLPVLLRYYEAHGAAPRLLSLGLAAQLALYQPSSAWSVEDTPDILARLAAHWGGAASSAIAVARILGDAELWSRDLTSLNGLAADVTFYMDEIQAGRLSACLADLAASEHIEDS